MSAPPPLPAPPPPLRPNLAHALGGVWRLTYRRFTGVGQLATLAGLLAGFLLLTYAVIHRGDTKHFSEWVISFYLLVIVPVLAFVSGGGMMRDDMKPGTVDYLLTRPVRRPAFVAARFGSQLVCLQLVFLVVLLALLGVGRAIEIPNVSAMVSTLGIAQGGIITAFLALGYLCGAASSRYLVLGIAYAGVVEAGLGNIPIQLSKISVLRHVRALLVDEFPRVFEQAIVPQGAITTSLMILLFVAVWLAGAAALFSVQEFAGQRPKDA